MNKFIQLVVFMVSIAINVSFFSGCVSYCNIAEHKTKIPEQKNNYVAKIADKLGVSYAEGEIEYVIFRNILDKIDNDEFESNVIEMPSKTIDELILLCETEEDKKDLENMYKLSKELSGKKILILNADED